MATAAFVASDMARERQTRPRRTCVRERLNAELVFSRDVNGRTYLRRQLVRYPFHVCRPFYVEKDPPGMATLYVQCCSPGLLQGDNLRTSVIVDDDAFVHFTTA